MAKPKNLQIEKNTDNQTKPCEVMLKKITNPAKLIEKLRLEHQKATASSLSKRALRSNSTVEPFRLDDEAEEEPKRRGNKVPRTHKVNQNTKESNALEVIAENAPVQREHIPHQSVEIKSPKSSGNTSKSSSSGFHSIVETSPMSPIQNELVDQDGTSDFIEESDEETSNIGISSIMKSLESANNTGVEIDENDGTQSDEVVDDSQQDDHSNDGSRNSSALRSRTNEIEKDADAHKNAMDKNDAEETVEPPKSVVQVRNKHLARAKSIFDTDSEAENDVESRSSKSSDGVKKTVADNEIVNTPNDTTEVALLEEKSTEPREQCGTPFTNMYNEYATRSPSLEQNVTSNFDALTSDTPIDSVIDDRASDRSNVSKGENIQKDPSKSKKQNLKLFPKSSTSKSQEQLDDPIQQLTDEVSPTKKIDTYTMDAETPPAHISEPFDNELESVALEEHVIDQNENMLKNLAEKSTGQYVLKKHNGVMQRTKRVFQLAGPLKHRGKTNVKSRAKENMDWKEELRMKTPKVDKKSAFGEVTTTIVKKYYLLSEASNENKRNLKRKLNEMNDEDFVMVHETTQVIKRARPSLD